MQLTPTKVIISLSTFIGLLFSFLSTALPINDVTVAEISDSYPVAFMPEGFAFAIWGLIYATWGAFTIYAFTKNGERSEILKKLTVPYAISTLANAGWLVAWHYYQVGISLLIMVTLLLSLLYGYMMIRKVKPLSIKENLTIYFTFSLYLGWILVATVLNVTVFLHELGWAGGGISGEVWAATLVLVVVLLGLLFIWRDRDYVIPSVFIWSLFALAVKQSDLPLVLGTSIGGILVLVILLLVFSKRASIPHE